MVHIIDMEHTRGGLTPLSIRLGWNTRGVSALRLSDRAHHHAHTRNRNLVGDRDMAIKDARAADNAVLTDRDRACEGGATCDCCTVADLDVMGDLAQIVDDDIGLNNGVIKRAAIDTGASTDLHPVADDDAAGLRNLDPLTLVISVAKAVTANYGA